MVGDDSVCSLADIIIATVTRQAQRVGQRAVFPAVLLPTVNWELVARHKEYCTWMRLMVTGFLGTCASGCETYPLTPPLGTASAAGVYRVLAAVVSSLRERTR